MTSPPSPAALETLGLGVVIALLVLRRAYAQYRGAPVSVARLASYSVIYPLLLVVVVGVDTNGLLPLWSLALDVGAVVLGGALAMRYVRRHATIYRDGAAWMFRLDPLVPLVYVALFVARLVLEVAFGIDPFGPAPSALSSTTLDVIIALDALFAFSTGLAVGRNAGVYQAWVAAVRAAPPASVPAVRP